MWLQQFPLGRPHATGKKGTAKATQPTRVQENAKLDRARSLRHARPLPPGPGAGDQDFITRAAAPTEYVQGDMDPLDLGETIS